MANGGRYRATGDFSLDRRKGEGVTLVESFDALIEDVLELHASRAKMINPSDIIFRKSSGRPARGTPAGNTTRTGWAPLR